MAAARANPGAFERPARVGLPPGYRVTRWPFETVTGGERRQNVVSALAVPRPFSSRRFHVSPNVDRPGPFRTRSGPDRSAEPPVAGCRRVSFSRPPMGAYPGGRTPPPDFTQAVVGVQEVAGDSRMTGGGEPRRVGVVGVAFGRGSTSCNPDMSRGGRENFDASGNSICRGSIYGGDSRLTSMCSQRRTRLFISYK